MPKELPAAKKYAKRIPDGTLAPKPKSVKKGAKPPPPTLEDQIKERQDYYKRRSDNGNGNSSVLNTDWVCTSCGFIWMIPNKKDASEAEVRGSIRFIGAGIDTCGAYVMKLSDDSPFIPWVKEEGFEPFLSMDGVTLYSKIHPDKDAGPVKSLTEIELENAQKETKK